MMAHAEQLLHRMFRPGIIIAQCNLPGIVLSTLAMAEPVTHHELNLGGRQDVDRCQAGTADA